MPSALHEKMRVLIAFSADRLDSMLTLFANDVLSGWDAVPAQTFAQARFAVQHQPCDLLIVGGDLLDREGVQGLAWLAFQREAPLLFLGDDRAFQYLQAYELGAEVCLPWSLASTQPTLLFTVMQQTLQSWEAKLTQRRTLDQLADSRRHVDRLVQLIWRLQPRHDDHWYSQRHMLERLDEELARCVRHQVPLSLAVGELQPIGDDGARQLPDWAAESIVRGKRRSDVVGQYGPRGFMLLMTHTPKAGGVTCCKRLQDSLAHPGRELEAPNRLVRSFMGIASVNDGQSSPQSLLHVAEQHLEAARHHDSSTVVAD